MRNEVPNDAEWREDRYIMFEMWGVPGSFVERAAAIRTFVRIDGVPWLREIDQFCVLGRADLERGLDEVLKAGGEG